MKDNVLKIPAATESVSKSRLMDSVFLFSQHCRSAMVQALGIYTAGYTRHEGTDSLLRRTAVGSVRTTAKLFPNGASQAVRLPAEFRFEGTEVYIRRDPRTGDVVLSPTRRKGWASFKALRDELLPALEQGQGDQPGDADPLQERAPAGAPRDPFDGWVE